MPDYRYTAKTLQGKSVKGVMKAADKPALVTQLHQNELFLLSCEEVGILGKSSQLKANDLARFNRQLGAMLASGITLIRAIEIIMQRDLPQKQRAIFESIYRDVLSGYTLSDALAATNGAFPDLLINMYKAAEANGTMDLTAGRMAEHYEKEHRLKSKLRTASTYPIVLLCLTVVVVILIFTLILPNFMSLYGTMELPAITRFVISASTLFTERLPLLLGSVLCLLLIISFLGINKPLRFWLDKHKLRVPVIGKLLRTIYTAQLARTLSSLYASGLTVMTTLQVAKNTLPNRYVSKQFDQVVSDVRNGVALSTAIGKVDGFDKKLTSTILVGEESGQLESMLLSISDDFDYEADQATQKLSSLLEPILIILMAVVIGTILIAVMLPIYQMYGNIGI